MGTSAISITYLLPNLESGGTERQLLHLAGLLPPSRYSLSLVTTSGGGSLFREFSKIMPVTVRGDPERGKQFRSRLAEHLRTVAFLAGFLRRQRPDILHTYLPAANLLGPVAARLARVRGVVISKRALANYKNDYPLLRRMESIGNFFADIVLVNSDAVLRDVQRTERFWTGKFRKIYNGVEPRRRWTAEEVAALRRREGIPGDAPVAITVSNFYPYKGHADLVHAARRVARERPEVCFLLVGRDAGTLTAVRDLTASNGLNRNVRFLGHRTDVPDLLQAADLYVHPSTEEGFSNAILEAMAAGRPTVACDVGGNPEAVLDGVTGSLVPPREPDRLAEAVLFLLERPDARARMGVEARRRAQEHFSLAEMVVKIRGLYETLVSPGR